MSKESPMPAWMSCLALSWNGEVMIMKHKHEIIVDMNLMTNKYEIFNGRKILETPYLGHVSRYLKHASYDSLHLGKNLGDIPRFVLQQYEKK